MRTLPGGTWPSPIHPATLSDEIRLNDVQWDDLTGALVWHERRPTGGVIVAQIGDEAPRELTDSNLSVSGGVGYGGGEFTVGRGEVIFCASKRLWHVSVKGGLARPITPAYAGCAAPALSTNGRWVAYINHYENRDSLAIVERDGSNWPRKLIDDSDFVMQPHWHPHGEWLACITWNMPSMPWNGTSLRLLRLSYESHSGLPYVELDQTIAGGEKTAVLQPTFSPDGRYLAYISDDTGWGHLYLYDLENETHIRLTDGEVEFGLPGWIQGLRTFGWSADSRYLYLIGSQNAFYQAMLYDLVQGRLQRLNGLEDYTYLSQIAVSSNNDTLAFAASGARIPIRIIRHQVIEQKTNVIRRAGAERLPTSYLAPIQAMSWQANDMTIHGLYSPPAHPDINPDGPPPLIVRVHGGPSSQAPARYEGVVNFFTTRGYAVLQVNHRGSTGYGKSYLDAHQGAWGIADVEDSLSGARHLVELGLADPDRLVIMGGSAGGYTVLQALCDHPGFFRAGICAYGVANQFSLAMDTHKFEARYNDWLLGPLPSARDIYRARSPLFKAEKIRDALLIFQGADDNVVPPNQSEAIVAALRRSGTPHEYYLYEGEGHGWRQPKTITDYYQRIERFLLQYVVYA